MSITNNQSNRWHVQTNNSRPHKMRCAALFYVYFPHSACIPCGVYYVAPSLFHTSDHVYNFTAACHVTGRWERGRATPQLRLRTSTMQVFRLSLLMAIFKVSLLQTRLRLDMMRHTQVTVVLFAYVCGTQSIVHREMVMSRPCVEMWHQLQVYPALVSRKQTSISHLRRSSCQALLPVCSPKVSCQWMPIQCGIKCFYWQMQLTSTVGN